MRREGRDAGRGVTNEYFVLTHEEYMLLRMRRAYDTDTRQAFAVIEDWDDGFQRFHGMKLAIVVESLRIDLRAKR